MAFDLSSLTSFLKNEVSKAPTKSGVLGVDVGSSAIKVVQLKEVKGVPTLETYGELQLGPYEGTDLGRGTHLPERKMTEALIDIIRESGVTTKSVALALSYNSSFTTTILVPTLDQDQIGTMIPIEARKYIPTALSKVTLDWFPLAIKEGDKATQVLLSATYTEAVARYESIVRGTGSNIAVNEIETFSSIRTLLAPTDSVVAILDCGASATRMYIVVNGVIRKTHSVLLSGVEITQALTEGLSLDFKHAEEIKRIYGLEGKPDDPRVQKIITKSIERGFRELHTVIKRYEEEEKVTVGRVIVSGGGALLRGLLSYAKDMFSHSVVAGDPFSKVAYPAFLEDTLKEAGPSFSVAIGVALRAFQKN